MRSLILKFRRTNKPYIDQDDQEIEILEAMNAVYNKKYSKIIDDAHMKYNREGRITMEQYNKLVKVYNYYFDQEEVEDDCIEKENRQAALNLKKEYADHLRPEFQFLVTEKFIEMKRYKSVSRIDLGSPYAIRLLKNHILSRTDGNE